MGTTFSVGDPTVTGLPIGITPDTVPPGLTTLQRQKFLLNNEWQSDAVLLVGPEIRTAIRIPIHTVFLRTASIVFDFMFSEKWMKEEPIRISDYKLTTVFSLLRWCYCEELVYQEGQLADVLRIADKYMVTSLSRYVPDQIYFVDQASFWPLLDYAVEFEAEDLRKKWLERFADNPGKFICDIGFLNIAPATLTTLLLTQETKVDEFLLFMQCLDWASAECNRQHLEVSPENQRNLMAGFIHCFTFSKLDATRLDHVCQTGILTESEQQILVMQKHADGIVDQTSSRMENEYDIRGRCDCPARSSCIGRH